MERAQLQIDFVREFRIRLIADVVTGKIDVREAAARLPDEVDPVDRVDALADGDESEDEVDLEATSIEAQA